MKKPYTAPKVYINGLDYNGNPKLEYYNDNNVDIIILKTSLINYLNRSLYSSDKNSKVLDCINNIPDSLYENVLDCNKTGLLYYISILAEYISANLSFYDIDNNRLKLLEFIKSIVRTPKNTILK